MPTKTYYRKLLHDDQWEVGYITRAGIEKPLCTRTGETSAIQSIDRFTALDEKISVALWRAIKKIQENPELFDLLKKG